MLSIILILNFVIAINIFAYNQIDFKNSMEKGALRLLNVQNGDGTWQWEITDLTEPTGEGSVNINGITALGILYTYLYTDNEDLLNAALKTGDWLVNIQSQPDHQWLYYQDIYFLYQLFVISHQLKYYDTARSAIRYIYEVKTPSAKQVVEKAWEASINISWHLSWAILTYKIFDYNDRAVEIADYTDPDGEKDGLVKLQAKVGEGEGLFLSASDFENSGEDLYLFKDTAMAIIALNELNKVTNNKYEENVNKAINALIKYFNYYSHAEGAFPAGLYHNRQTDEWGVVGYEYYSQDQAYTIWALSLLNDYTVLDSACSYLTETQRTEPNKEGWYLIPDNGDWSNPLTKEYANVDSEILIAFHNRLSLDRPPFILLAGFEDSEVSYSNGGTVSFIAWVNDPDGNEIDNVEIYVGGEPTGVTLPKIDNNFYGILNVLVDPGVPAGKYLAELVATDIFGKKSTPWPYLKIYPASNYFSYSQDLNIKLPPWYFYKDFYSEKDTNKPYIHSAGYYFTYLDEEKGGNFTILAFVIDPNNDVNSVELYYEGLPTGVYLYDDGQHNDFAAGDGIFGFNYYFDEGSLNGFAGQYLFELKAFDSQNNESYLWPYFIVTQ